MSADWVGVWIAVLGVGLTALTLLSRYWTTQGSARLALAEAAMKVLEARIAAMEAAHNACNGRTGQRDIAVERLEAKIDKLALSLEHVKETWTRDLANVATSIELRLRRELLEQHDR